MMKKLLLGLILPVLLSGCTYFKSEKDKMASVVFYEALDSEAQIILLPGLGMPVTDFEKQGVVAAIRACNSNIDIIAADAYLDYYRQKSIVNKLFSDVISPRLATGHKKTWLLGISLGGFGALSYRDQQLSKLEGVIVMAPYLGSNDDVQTYLTWQRQGMAIADMDETALSHGGLLALWESIQLTAKEKPAITLAYGKEDKFAPSLAWFTSYLPKESVLITEGKHKWVTWNTLWASTLEATGLCDGSLSN